MPDSTHILSDHVIPQVARIRPGAALGRAPDTGWTLLHDCLIAAGIRVDVVAMQAETGIAILEIEPRWTEGAERLLRATLAEAGFGMLFPGRLPVVHRRLQPIHLPLIPELMAETFVWQPLPTLPTAEDWVGAARDILADLPAAAGADPVADPKAEAPAGEAPARALPEVAETRPEPVAQAPLGSGDLAPAAGTGLAATAAPPEASKALAALGSRGVTLARPEQPQERPARPYRSQSGFAFKFRIARPAGPLRRLGGRGAILLLAAGAVGALALTTTALVPVWAPGS